MHYGIFIDIVIDLFDGLCNLHICCSTKLRWQLK